MNEHKQLLPFTPSLVLDEIRPEHWIMGANSEIKGDILVPNGDWTPYCPKGEAQNITIETYNCTGFGYTNRLEILWKFLFKTERNFSDRGVGIVAGTKPPGNSPHTVAEAVRQNGLLDEIDLPFDDSIKTLEQFYSPSPLTSNLIEKAKSFLSTREPLHDWVNTDIASLRYALKFSPLMVTVTAWFRNGDGLYYCPPGMPNQHDTTLVKINDDGTKVVFDSYPDNSGSFFKTLTADHPIQLSKRYHFGPGVAAKRNIILQLIDKLWELFRITPPDPVIVPDQTIPPKVEPAPPKYLWDIKSNVRHSIRVICDEELPLVKEVLIDGKFYYPKDVICGVIQAESQFNTQALNVNPGGTVDYGLCQFNDGKNKDGIPYWIGPGAAFSSVEEVLNNPEKCVRVMIRAYKQGGIGNWSAYKNGSYKKYL